MAVSLREVVSFGRYEPLFRIASGGMAEVFAARIRGEAGFQKLVAVKRMHPHMATDQSFVDMFLNEARLAAHISSPNVVQTLDLGRGSDGSLYIVMELVVGLSLAALVDLRRAPLPVPIVLALMAQAAQGLEDAHDATTPAGDELGLVHRDISPHNILVGLDGRARVTDFGIARAVHAPRSETNVKELKGKFAYMSPEQTRLKPLDHRSDVFSLGVVTWELLVGDKLFADVDAGLTIKNVRRRRIAAPHERVPAVPEKVSAVVMKALERLPTKRYQSAGVLADALRRAGQEMGGVPKRKRVAEFVRETGGEELERLQRLIRLGTEGAAEEDFEKVRPGSTQVLGTADASGVLRIDDEASEAPKIQTITLSESDEIALDTDDLVEAPPPREELDTRELAALPRTAPSEEGGDEALPETSEYVKVAVDPSAPPLVPQAAPEPPARSTGRWLALGIGAGLLLVSAAGASLWIMSADDSDAVPMPVAPPAGETPTDTAPGQTGPGQTGPPQTVPDPPTPPEETPTPPPAEEPTEPPAVEEPTDPPPAGDPGSIPTEGDEGEQASGEPTADSADPAARRRRRRRGRARRRAAEDSDDEPLLLDVNAFDQRTP